MKKIETYGSVKSGILHISYREKFNQSVKFFPDCRVRVIVEKLYNKRSTSSIKPDGENGRGQNGYYWTVIVSEYQTGAWETQQRGLSINQAHEELKSNCNYREHLNQNTGEIMREIQSTSNLTTVQFEEYLDRCREFIREWFGINCPLPNEQSELQFK